MSAVCESAEREGLAQTEVCQNEAHYNRSAVISKERVQAAPPIRDGKCNAAGCQRFRIVHIR